MFRTLLLATDGSENARRATEYAIELAAGLEVHALLEEEARRAVGPTLDLLDGAKVPYTLRAALGDPAAAILGLVEKEGADLIVLGSRGLGALSGLVMGSVTQKFVHLAPCPVLIVK